MSRAVPSSEIAQHLSAQHEGAVVAVIGIATVDEAVGGQLAFVTDAGAKAESARRALDSGAVVLFPADAETPPTGPGAVLRVANPRAAFASAVREFFAPRVTPGIASTAVIDPTARISPTAHIGEFVVIGPEVEIGEFTEVRNHTVIAAGVRIGAHCLIRSHAVIGEEGFGIETDGAGNNIRLPHLGSVVIDDHVEVGAFSTVCSGTIAPTRIGHHTKIDDHVHVAHNCQVGANVIMTACAELSGSVTVGDGAWFGPNSSVLQGLTIGEGTLIGIGAVVTRSAGARGVYFGSPAKRIRDLD